MALLSVSRAAALNRRGRPVTWFTQDRTDRTAKTRERKAKNQQLPCDVPGCTHHRDGLSSLCREHAMRLKDCGDPIARLPTALELSVFEKAIDLYLAHVLSEDERQRLETELSYQTKLVSRPVSWAAKPSDMHRRIPQKGRAEIVKATVLKEGGDLRQAVIRALAVEGWALVYFSGMERYRERFIHTQAGRWFTKRGTPSVKRQTEVSHLDHSRVLFTPNGVKHPRIYETETRYERAHISGPVRKVLGEEALKIAHGVFGKTFWETPVSAGAPASSTASRDPALNGELTLLDFTKHALRAAAL